MTEKVKRTTVIGILAHVDAGKTTLSEGLLYTAGALRKLGRVDHGNAFLDHFALERERGITIFSKQANFSWKELEIVLLDTPGHVDFSAETERTLQVLDYCLLVINGSDGVQGHTETLWGLLKRYEVPVFLFVNKMDQPGADRQKLMCGLRERFGSECVEFGDVENPAWREDLAVCSEALMEEYLATGDLREESIARAIAARQVFPCCFGAALRLEGVEELLEGLRRFTLAKEYPTEFGARVYKISRDAAGSRLTHLKVTGGRLQVKMPVNNHVSAAEGEGWEEKVDSLRIYDGGGFRAADQVEAGGICAVTGLSRTFAGQGLGCEGASIQPLLEPILSYRLVLPEGTDVLRALGQLRNLEEEVPELHVAWSAYPGAGTGAGEIQVRIMGEVQTEVLSRLIAERFGMEVRFESGRLLYRETIASSAVGIGHFEPLRHYAEVHLLLEPGEPGSGLEFALGCSEDELERSWQRLVLAHLEEKAHPGVLTGSPITDMKITLLTGRAHLKHTEGGDFRQAAYRALRQGLMQCESILLEPVFSFVLEVPAEQLGRAMSDVQRMCGSFAPPEMKGGSAVLTGSAPVSAMRDYQREVSAYTKGRGRLVCALKGYEPCHNAEEVIGQIGYDPDADAENPSASVFCAHGAGFPVGWEEVAAYAHVESRRRAGQADRTETRWEEDPGEAGGRGSGSHPQGAGERDAGSRPQGAGMRPARGGAGVSRTGRGHRTPEGGRSDYITQEEIEEIFLRTYGKSAQSYTPYRYYRQNTGGSAGLQTSAETPAESCGNETAGVSAGGAGRGDGSVSGGGGRGAGEGKHSAQMQEEYFLVDGYNIIFAWEELRSLAQVNMDSARDKLMDICCNFQGYHGGTLILVFDAYKVRGNPGSVQKYHNIHVVYTREAETADQYIEKTAHQIGKKHRVTVATSDALEQMIIWGSGAVRLSARGFREAVENAGRCAREELAGGRKLSQGLRLPEQL